MTTKHTPTPWRTDGEQCDDIRAECGAFVCVTLDCEYTMIGGRVHGAPDSATSRANAAFIVRAVNYHYALVAIVRRMLDSMDQQREYLGDHEWICAVEGCEVARALLAQLDAGNA